MSDNTTPGTNLTTEQVLNVSRGTGKVPENFTIINRTPVFLDPASISRALPTATPQELGSLRIRLDRRIANTMEQQNRQETELNQLASSLDKKAGDATEPQDRERFSMGSKIARALATKKRNKFVQAAKQDREMFRLVERELNLPKGEARIRFLKKVVGGYGAITGMDFFDWSRLRDAYGFKGLQQDLGPLSVFYNVISDAAGVDKLGQLEFNPDVRRMESEEGKKVFHGDFMDPAFEKQLGLEDASNLEKFLVGEGIAGLTGSAFAKRHGDASPLRFVTGLAALPSILGFGNTERQDEIQSTLDRGESIELSTGERLAHFSGEVIAPADPATLPIRGVGHLARSAKLAKFGIGSLLPEFLKRFGGAAAKVSLGEGTLKAGTTLAGGAAGFAAPELGLVEGDGIDLIDRLRMGTFGLVGGRALGAAPSLLKKGRSILRGPQAAAAARAATEGGALPHLGDEIIAATDPFTELLLAEGRAEEAALREHFLRVRYDTRPSHLKAVGRAVGKGRGDLKKILNHPEVKDLGLDKEQVMDILYAVQPKLAAELDPKGVLEPTFKKVFDRLNAEERLRSTMSPGEWAARDAQKLDPDIPTHILVDYNEAVTREAVRARDLIGGSLAPDAARPALFQVGDTVALDRGLGQGVITARTKTGYVVKRLTDGSRFHGSARHMERIEEAATREQVLRTRAATGTPKPKGATLKTKAAARTAREAPVQAAQPTISPPTTQTPPGASLTARRPPPASEQIMGKSADELHEMYLKELDLEEGAAAEVFGAEQAKIYDKAQRRANNVNLSRAQQDEAFQTIERMEAGLSEAQKKRLFGSVEEGLNAEDLRYAAREIGAVESAGSLEGLARALRKSLTDIGDLTDVTKANFDQALAFAKLQRGHQIALERGWDLTKLSDQTLKAAFARFDDPMDAAFVLNRFAAGKKARQELATPAGGRTQRAFREDDVFDLMSDEEVKALGDALDAGGANIGKFDDLDPAMQRELLRLAREDNALKPLVDKGVENILPKKIPNPHVDPKTGELTEAAMKAARQKADKQVLEMTEIDYNPEIERLTRDMAVLRKRGVPDDADVMQALGREMAEQESMKIPADLLEQMRAKALAEAIEELKNFVPPSTRRGTKIAKATNVSKEGGVQVGEAVEDFSAAVSPQKKGSQKVRRDLEDLNWPDAEVTRLMSPRMNSERAYIRANKVQYTDLAIHDVKREVARARNLAVEKEATKLNLLSAFAKQDPDEILRRIEAGEGVFKDADEVAKFIDWAKGKTGEAFDLDEIAPLLRGNVRGTKAIKQAQAKLELIKIGKAAGDSSVTLRSDVGGLGTILGDLMERVMSRSALGKVLIRDGGALRKEVYRMLKGFEGAQRVHRAKMGMSIEDRVMFADLQEDGLKAAMNIPKMEIGEFGVGAVGAFARPVWLLAEKYGGPHLKMVARGAFDAITNLWRGHVQPLVETTDHYLRLFDDAGRKRIFRALDAGAKAKTVSEADTLAAKAIGALSGEERQAALMLQDTFEHMFVMQNQMRRSLGLKAKTRRGSYVTHIFDNSVDKRFYSDGLDRLDADDAVSKFLKARDGNLEYIDDVALSTKAYMNSTFKDIVWTPVLKDFSMIRPFLKNNHTKRTLQKGLEMAAGIHRPWADKQMFKATDGIPPKNADKILRAATGWIYIKSLGASPRAVLINLTQSYFTVAKVGPIHTVRALGAMMKHGVGLNVVGGVAGGAAGFVGAEQAELGALGTLLSVGAGAAAGAKVGKAVGKRIRGLSPAGQKLVDDIHKIVPDIDKIGSSADEEFQPASRLMEKLVHRPEILGAFGAAEQFNRMLAALAGKFQAEAMLKKGILKTQDDVIAHARQVVRETQFWYTALDRPQILSEVGSAGRPFVTFQQFRMRGLDFFYSRGEEAMKALRKGDIKTFAQVGTNAAAGIGMMLGTMAAAGMWGIDVTSDMGLLPVELMQDVMQGDFDRWSPHNTPMGQAAAEVIGGVGELLNVEGMDGDINELIDQLLKPLVVQRLQNVQRLPMGEDGNMLQKAEDFLAGPLGDAQRVGRLEGAGRIKNQMFSAPFRPPPGYGNFDAGDLVYLSKSGNVTGAKQSPRKDRIKGLGFRLQEESDEFNAAGEIRDIAQEKILGRSMAFSPQDIPPKTEAIESLVSRLIQVRLDQEVTAEEQVEMTELRAKARFFYPSDAKLNQAIASEMKRRRLTPRQKALNTIPANRRREFREILKEADLLEGVRF